ncbi:hypothetical protein LSAT2_024205 [Lamellibrachia satsuma]|nr:hypothetical protein LSAT2_024205 [Lamellibrachia satsuma]
MIIFYQAYVPLAWVGRGKGGRDGFGGNRSKYAWCFVKRPRTHKRTPTRMFMAYHVMFHGISDHATVVLIPTYRQKLKTIKPTTKTVRKRTADSTIALKACLDSTDWQMFKDSCHDLDSYTDTVTAYISWCEETCYESKSVTVYGNDKPWFTRDIKQKLAMKNSAFISGNREDFRRAKYAVRKAISSAKYKYKRKLENQFASNNTRSVWQGLHQITQYKPSASAIYNADPSFPDQLNDFYSRFDKLNTSPEQRPLPTDTPLSPPFTVNVADVRTLFKRLSTRKASGPDNISSYTFKNCADQLAPVFADIYNSSLQQCIVPTCFKTSVIIPIPKKAKVSTMNDYRPVALTSVAMKVFEHIMLRYLKSSTAGLLDPHQFAYQTNRYVDDAVALGLHYVMNHLEQPSTYPPQTEKCAICTKSVYAAERCEAGGKIYHKNCFKCSHCKMPLNLNNYTQAEGIIYCKNHYQEFIVAKNTQVTT